MDPTNIKVECINAMHSSWLCLTLFPLKFLKHIYTLIRISWMFSRFILIFSYFLRAKSNVEYFINIHVH